MTHNDSMLTFGKDVFKGIAEPLETMPIEAVAEMIGSGKNGLKEEIMRLRIVQSVDKEAYTKQKTRLPFVCGSLFEPMVRQGKNFKAALAFSLDLDHINEPGIEEEIKIKALQEMKAKLSEDPFVWLCFISPGQDGLKIWFRLGEEIKSLSLFKTGYKSFAQAFARKHDLEDKLDRVTCDATRICFLSWDPELVFNPAAQPVYFDLPNQSDEAIMQPYTTVLATKNADSLGEPDTEAIRKIREKIGIRKPINLHSKAGHIYSPEQLEQVSRYLINELAQQGIETEEDRPINYGRQLEFRLGKTMACVNIFYGKSGYSISIVPKRGTDASLNELCRDLLSHTLAFYLELSRVGALPSINK